MSVLAGQQARHSGNLPPLEFPPAAECPLIPKNPFALPNLALGAARATADARRSRHASANGRPGLQCRHCMATRPGRGQQQWLASRLYARLGQLPSSEARFRSRVSIYNS